MRLKPTDGWRSLFFFAARRTPEKDNGHDAAEPPLETMRTLPVKEVNTAFRRCRNGRHSATIKMRIITI
jgi:hypothetical protein